MAIEHPERRTLYLLDGTAQLFRAYYALAGLTSADGLATNAVYGFTTMLRKLIREERPPYLGVAFDLPGPVFRHDSFAQYKANRPAAPEDLNAQVPYAKQVCQIFGVPVLEQTGFEADDLIATYARLARLEGFDVVVVASDKDLLQLVGTGVTVLDPVKGRHLDAEQVAATFGVPPERVRDVLGLMGDSVDNIPGVPGVGQKTALALVSAYGDMDAVIERARRFVEAYDARDRLVAAIDAAATAGRLDEAAAAGLRAGAGELAHAVDRLLGLERDPESADGLRAVGPLLTALETEQLVGREARVLASLKRRLKELDRGSSKRIWYAIAGHVDQARISKELATLRADVPVEYRVEQMVLGEPDRRAAQVLFSRLGFRSLLDERAAAECPGELAAPSVQRVTSEVVTTREHLERLVAEAAGVERLALRVLADGEDPRQARIAGIALAWRHGAGIYIPLGHDHLGAPEQLSARVLAEVLGPRLADPRTAIVGHDLKNDLHLLRREAIEVARWGLDTMVAAFLLNANRSSYPLHELSDEFLGHKALRLDDLLGSGAKQRRLQDVAVESVAEHAAEQAENVLRLAELLELRLRDAGVIDLYRSIDGPLLPLLAQMEDHGIRVDCDMLRSMSESMQVELASSRRTIHQLAGGEFNVDSPKQLREVLFDKLGLKSRRKTAKSRSASTDAQTLEELAEQHEIAARLLDYRELAKLKSTYVDSLPRLVDPLTGRVHTRYHPTGAATGRLSSSNPNLQNIPVRSEIGRRIRKAFVAAEGWIFLASDYSQIELRVLAHLAGDPELVAAFRAGEDIHRHTAARVFGVAPDLVTDPMRRRAKAINFGLLYGMSEGRLAREQGLSRSDARQFIQTYFARFARVREYIDATREQARRDAAVRTLFGRVRHFPQLRQRTNHAIQEQALRAAVNTTIQGTAADLMKLAMLRVDLGLCREGLEARILLQVHDELLLELPVAELDRVRLRVREAMEGVHPLDVPLVVDQKAGNNWFDVT